jgi:hypothetical protein
MSVMPRLPTVLLLCLLALPGCGGGGDDAPERRSGVASSTAGEGAASPEPGEGGAASSEPGEQDAEASPGGSSSRPRPRTGPVTRGERAVIRGWADALRRGDVERATRYWSVPAIAANGGQPFRLVTRRAVRRFNEGLTCGARLESVERDTRYLLATFRLTNRRDRPGACAQGVGNRARTLFLLRDGRIVQWIRATDPPSGSTS